MTQLSPLATAHFGCKFHSTKCGTGQDRQTGQTGQTGQTDLGIEASSRSLKIVFKPDTTTLNQPSKLYATAGKGSKRLNTSSRRTFDN